MIKVIKDRQRANKQGNMQDVLAYRLNLSGISTKGDEVSIYVGNGISITITMNDIDMLASMTRL